MDVGIEFIALERKEQIEKHGFSIDQDIVKFNDGNLKNAVIFCLTLDEEFYPKSWGTWFKDNIYKKKRILGGGQQFDIEISRIIGALMAANIDKIIHEMS